MCSNVFKTYSNVSNVLQPVQNLFKCVQNCSKIISLSSARGPTRQAELDLVFTYWSIGAYGHIRNRMRYTLYLLNPRETEDTVIKIPDLMLLNKDADRKFELGGGFTTDSRFHT